MSAGSSSTYAALVTNKFSNDFAEALTLTQVPKRSPTGRDLLVKIKAFATNPIDAKLLKNFGDVEAKVPKPFVLGFDASGVVEDVGPEVKSFKPGDEVFFAGNVTRDGSFAEYTLIDEHIVALKPKTLGWAEAASIPLVSLTAWEGLEESLGIPVPQTNEEKQANAAKTLLVIGGAGGVGSVVIQLAKKVFGLHVITTASRPETIKFAKAQGADDILDHTKPLLDQLKARNIEGVEYVFNTVETSEYFDQILQVVKPLGKVVLITGPAGPLDAAAAFRKRITFAFEFMFARSALGIEPEKQGVTLSKLAALHDDGVLHHTLTRTFPFTEQGVVEALTFQASGKALGKIVVPVSE